MRTSFRFLQTACLLATLTFWLAKAQAQLTWVTNNGTIEITGGCPGIPGAVVIPDTINGRPVTSIGEDAFSGCTSLTGVAIPDSITTIGFGAFGFCSSLTDIEVDPLNAVYSSLDGVMFDRSKRTLIRFPSGKGGAYVIPYSVTSIEPGAFRSCANLTSIYIPDSVLDIGGNAFRQCYSLSTVRLSHSLQVIERGTFAYCESLKTVTIPPGVTQIIGSFIDMPGAFWGCPITDVFFMGNAPRMQIYPAFDSTSMISYYFPGTTGWSATFARRPTALWLLPEPLVLTSSPGVALQTNGFGFRISWATNSPVVVEATTSLSAPEWSPVSTNALVDGWVDFRDPAWAGQAQRFYRVRGP